MRNTGVKSIGIKCPIIREGDNIVKIVSDAVLEATAYEYDEMAFGGAGRELGYELNYKNQDVIGITESVVARAAGLYVTVDEIAEDIKKKYGENANILLSGVIFSRNRFSMILKGIARAAKKVTLYLQRPYDEVGNFVTNPFTNVNIIDYYKEICQAENCEFEVFDNLGITGRQWSDESGVFPISFYMDKVFSLFSNILDCRLHSKLDKEKLSEVYGAINYYTLSDVCSDKNPDFGLLGTNKATEEKLKLFPTVELAERVAQGVKDTIKVRTGKDVNVLIYGDGCFHSPAIEGVEGSSIWEFADPVTVPGHTHGILDGKPNEIKIKAFADDKYGNLKGEELEKAVKDEIRSKDANLVGNMDSQGTTPRRYVDLLASLCDLTSGSGDKGTPVVLIQDYFNNYSIDNY